MPSTRWPKKILLGYDGSQNARRALDRAIQLARTSRGELLIVFYVDLTGFEAIEAMKVKAGYRAQVLQEAETLVADASQLARRARLSRVRSLVLSDSDAADAILFAAVEQAPDLIVVGRRGVSRTRRFFLGSVSSRIIDYAKCDVLVVK